MSELKTHEKLALVDELEKALDDCDHPYADSKTPMKTPMCDAMFGASEVLPDWCNVCGATRIGNVWGKPHWRDLLIFWATGGHPGKLAGTL